MSPQNTSSFHPELAKIQEALNDGDITLTEMADGTGVVLDIENSQVLSLNASGLFIVKCLRGSCNPADIPVRISDEFEVSEEVAREDTVALLDRLAELLIGRV
jgi:hypothetical protein